MTLTFYKQAATPHRIRKQSYLTEMGTIDGTVKEPTNIISPVFTLKYNPIVYNSNYLYCSTTGRYYSYNDSDIRLLSGGRMSISARCDVLYTYRNEILASSAWVDVSDGAPDVGDDYNMLHNDVPFRADYQTLGCDLAGGSPLKPFGTSDSGAKTILMIIK